jgi:hypothetical protein
MLKRLIDIRNIVEHQDSSPPSTDECQMFADLVWYFLRSTDELVKSFLEGRMFWEQPDWRHREHDDLARVWLRFREPLSEPPGIDARLEMDHFADEPEVNWIRIEATNIEEYEALSPGGNEEKTEDWTAWVRVIGKVRGTEEQMKLIYQQYFHPPDFP